MTDHPGDWNGHVPLETGGTGPGLEFQQPALPAGDRIADAAERAAASLAALEQTARDALDRLDAILAHLG